jgi:hypothetical protein
VTDQDVTPEPSNIGPPHAGPPDAEPPAGSGSDARRELLTVLAIAVLAAGVIFLTASRPWLHVRVVRPAPFAPVIAHVTGRKEYAAVAGLAVAALLAIVLIAVTARLVRSVFGALIVITGLWCGWYAVRGLSSPSLSRARELVGDRATSSTSISVHTVPLWPVLTLIAGVVLAVAGAAVVVRGRSWNNGLSQRYSAPATAAQSEDPWRALDRGDDPTIADR